MTDDTNGEGGSLPHIPVLDARRDFADLIGRISKDKERVVLTRHGKDVAVVVPVDDLPAILAESGDVPPAQLATHVLSKFPANPTLEQAERWAIETGATIARSCSGGDGEQRFAAAWRTLARDARAAFTWPEDESGKSSDPCDGRLPYALMRMLRRERQLVIDSEAQNLRMSLTTPHHRQSVVEKIIGMDWKRWPIPLIHDLGIELERIGLESLPLTIGESGYHEERILAHFACDLFLAVNGYEGFRILPAPWALGRTVSDVWRSVNKLTGGADIRLVNKDIKASNDTTASTEIPDDLMIFRHVGYRAFANGAWLAGMTVASDTPASVRDWIKCLRDPSATESKLLHPDTLAARSWILMKGGPINYPQTEFDQLFEFLRSKVGSDLPQIETAATPPHPDDVFDDFLLGRRKVLMGGSIHDVLLEEFWTSENKTFVKIIDKNDFDGLKGFVGRLPGQNVMLFSPRMNAHPTITKLLREIYRELAKIVVASVKQNPSESKQALLTYIAIVLAPSLRENWNMSSSDPRWSFAGSSAGIERLLTTEMQLPS